MTEERILELFRKAEHFLRVNGFAQEISWCDNRIPFDDVDAQRFLHEYAWVVFNSGMRNRVIQQKWADICTVFIGFDPQKIVQDESDVRDAALMVFGHHGKVEAVIQMAKKLWFGSYMIDIFEKVKEDPLGFLETLPFIGKVTKFHLARNLGFDYVKPDRHLVRLASKYDMTPSELCNVIHEKTDRRVGTIDLILWRFCEQKGQRKLLLTGKGEDSS
ncbi:MAG: hypothetical protein OEY30_03860 [Candidatus Bathyarchaeota archaeon]|nr:hypothetical protein [Candidatus Bathyarchaeota archaeon]